MRDRELGINIHEEWIGMTQPVGLVVEPTVLDRFGIFPEKDIKVVSDFQRRLESLFEDQINGEKSLTVIKNLKDFCKEVLDWQDSDLLKPEEFQIDNKGKGIFVPLDDYEEILKPDWVVPEYFGNGKEKKIQILVKELDIGTPFDQIIKNSNNTKFWEATHQQRFERLLKESENPIGILWNGIAIRLVYAPRGESSGYINFPLEPMITVDGRPMIGAIEMLLGPDRLFEGGSSNLRLRTLMEQSRKEQNEVSTRLSEQVLEALWILVRGIDVADKKSRSLGKTILNDLPNSDPDHLYGGLITVLLRLVFLLYSEDEKLMPIDTLYVENYSISGLASRLRKDRNELQGAMEERYGAWSSLLSLFRLIFDGGGPYESYLPARHGELFDPDTYPFLEGRDKNNFYGNEVLNNVPLISDDVIDKVLTKLLILDGQLLSYRALDVEQIGSVYEAIMGFKVELAKGSSVGILYNPPRQKIRITYVVNAEKLLSQKTSNRESWLKQDAGVDLKFSPAIRRNLCSANNLEELCHALGSRLSPNTPRGLQKGSLILQPTLERRRSGSHYTPRLLTEPVIEESFRPWLESFSFKPSAKDILSLKICDPAMGSGAFLVAACRFLANFLVKAWERDEYPEEFNNSFDKDNYARRLVAQNCIYGVDKNIFAVSLAKLSIWLITLNKDLPFTFLDHALKSGNSLIGHSVEEIKNNLKNFHKQLSIFSDQNKVINNISYERGKIFSNDTRNDKSYDQKKESLKKQSNDTKTIRLAGDLLIAAFFDSTRNSEIESRKENYLSLLNDFSENEFSKKSINQICQKLEIGEKGIKPFHWDLEFPEVFFQGRDGFDIFIGNPPFAGKNTISSSNPDRIIDWLKNLHVESHGNADIVSHFFRRCFNLTRSDGSLGLITTNTISQGDTRSTGLRYICLNSGTIYSAKKRYKWPGVAAVIVSNVHIVKGSYSGNKFLNNRRVNQITAFLLPNGGHEDPKPLLANKSKSFQGSIVLGMGFTFDNSGDADSFTPGIPIPISIMEKLISDNPKNSEVIFPYIGGNEVNSRPKHDHHRFVIDFRDRKEEECWANWPEIMKLVEKKVKPVRQERKSNGQYKQRSPLPEKWWIHAEKRPELYKTINNCERVLVTNAQASQHYSQVFLSKNCVFANSLNVFPFQKYSQFSIMQSRVHEEFARYLSSSLKDDLRYNPSDCFLTFPMPSNLNEVEFSDDEFEQISNSLENIGFEYYKFRSNLLCANNEGLTNTYNRFHDPKETDSIILQLRNLHNQMDKIVLESYGWHDILIELGFGIDFLNINEDDLQDHNLKEFIETENLFFKDAKDACNFQNALQLSTGKKGKLAWRYRWTDEIREEIIARLFLLNEQRFLEENRNKNNPEFNNSIKNGINKKFEKISKKDDNDQLQLKLR